MSLNNGNDPFTELDFFIMLIAKLFDENHEPYHFV